MSCDYWLDEPEPAGPRHKLASEVIGTTVTVTDHRAGLVYRGRLAAYDYDTRSALIWVSAERLDGDNEWFYPLEPRTERVRCSLTDLQGEH